MASPYSTGSSNGSGYGFPSSKSYPRQHQPSFQSLADNILTSGRSLIRRLWTYSNGSGRVAALNLAMQGVRQTKKNLAARRLLSFPHLLVAVWVLVLLWGERWIFTSKVNSCDWDHWEDWPTGTTPHRLVFVADPQLIDPHTYPGRPWPLNPLTYTITDNYLRRSYKALQKVLHPDTVIFLGDMFDGGREWKTAHGDFNDAEWAKSHPANEQKYVKGWNEKYGEEYWLQEYARFNELFYSHWGLGGMFPGPWQRGRKVISSLPGNHDLGFGSEVKVPLRKRFTTYFGETNRVDVIGNHTFVSVDTVSLSAGTSIMKDNVDLHHIYDPVQDFLKEVKATKRRAVAKELRFWRGEVEEVAHDHKVEDLENANYKDLPSLDEGASGADFPTVLLTHVPLYRDPGTPCGPLREHWPPTKPPKGQTTPVNPDRRNALDISSGYQYQNVLSEEDSIRLIKSIGNVTHAFSGDDHDYCEIVHTEQKERVREITVKSLSMAMGIPTPGFQMVSLYNPIDENGKPLLGAGKPTLQTHLCLLPKQISTYTTYIVLGVFTIIILTARAFLVPVLNLQPFAMGSIRETDSAILPIFKAKVEADQEDGYSLQSQSSGNSASKLLSARTRGRGASVTNGSAPGTSPKPKGKWGWGESRGPRIEIRRDAYDGGKSRGIQWRSARRSNWRTGLQSRTALVGREIWTTIWRVVWMAVGFFAYLTYKG